MKALIFASGEGTRMGKFTEQRPKVLIPIDGVPLIKRIMNNLRLAGITEYYITVGYQSNIIKKELGKDFKGLPIIYIDNPNWKEGNLRSLTSAIDFIKEEFLLCMGDHLATVRFIKKLISERKNAIVTVAIDSKTKSSEDDTKVVIRDGKIIMFGKGITSKYVDCGYFVCKSEVFVYSGYTTLTRRFELSDCMNIIAGDEKIDYVDMSGEVWLDIDTPDDLENYYVKEADKEGL